MREITWLSMLQRFAEGGGAAASAGDGGTGAAGVAAPAAAADAGQQTGANPSDAGTAPAGGQEESFDTLVKGKYQKAFDAKVQEIVRERLKKPTDELRTLKETQKAWDKAHRLLAARYGMDAETMDPAALSDTMLRDDSYLQELADRNNTSVEYQRAQLNLQFQREQLEEIQRQQETEQADREYYSGLVQQEAVMRQTYPDFNIQQELQNERFYNLTRNGTSVEDAYWMLHRRELTEKMVQGAVQKAQQAAAAAVASGAKRPTEAGTGASSAATLQKTQKWTEERMRQIREAVARGEKVGPGHPLWG